MVIGHEEIRAGFDSGTADDAHAFREMTWGNNAMATFERMTDSALGTIPIGGLVVYANPQEGKLPQE